MAARCTAYGMHVDRTFSVAEARALLAELMPTLTDLIAVRADATELGWAVKQGLSSHLGGLAELKAAHARFDELVSQIVAADVHVKGVAPLLLDFPAELDGAAVLLCWLEGDQELAWYHRVELGFAGRRKLSARS